MSILSFSTHRDFASWLMWLLVLVSILLTSGSTLPDVAMTGLPTDIWQSPFDPVPWLGRFLRLQWYTVWWKIRGRVNEWERWMVLAIRLWSCHSLAEIIQALTRTQVVRQLSALPILVALLTRLKVRATINRHCPTHSPVDNGAVALVLVLNRLMAPRPLYKVVDWLSLTLIAEQVGFSKFKFNDDRLGRTLDTLAEHLPAIWTDIQHQTLLRYKIDLSVVFYDLTALIMTGKYDKSSLVDYGFAHNTPSDDPKVKLGMVASQDGGVPLLFQPWSGRTADKSTVQTNMYNLRQFLQHNGWSASQVLVVGDCANLNSELAIAYQDANLRYLAGLGKLEKVHKNLILAPRAEDFKRLPLTKGTDDESYWGVPCQVPFTHDGRKIAHRGLVVLSGPMQQAFRETREQDLKKLALALHQVRGKIGQKRYRSEKEINLRIATQLKKSPVANLLKVQLTARQENNSTDDSAECVAGECSVLATIPQNRFILDWYLDLNALETVQRADGRYLLVTNDNNLSHPQMLALYRKKDAVEKRFEVSKQDLKIRPLYVHSDERIQAMLLINLIALLVYSLLERQAEQYGLCLTARQIIARLSTLQVQLIEAWDGSRIGSWIETADGQALLLTAILSMLDEKPRPILSTDLITRYLLPDGLPAQGDTPPTQLG
jgi:transposase